MRPDLYLPTIKHPGALEKAAGGKTTVGQGFNPVRIGEYIPTQFYPSVNIWEAFAYTLPGIVAHQSALKGGEPRKIRDFGSAGS